MEEGTKYDSTLQVNEDDEDIRLESNSEDESSGSQRSPSIELIQIYDAAGQADDNPRHIPKMKENFYNYYSQNNQTMSRVVLLEIPEPQEVTSVPIIMSGIHSPSKSESPLWNLEDSDFDDNAHSPDYQQGKISNVYHLDVSSYENGGEINSKATISKSVNSTLLEGKFGMERPSATPFINIDPWRENDIENIHSDMEDAEDDYGTSEDVTTYVQSGSMVFKGALNPILDVHSHGQVHFSHIVDHSKPLNSVETDTAAGTPWDREDVEQELFPIAFDDPIDTSAAAFVNSEMGLYQRPHGIGSLPIRGGREGDDDSALPSTNPSILTEQMGSDHGPAVLSQKPLPRDSDHRAGALEFQRESGVEHVLDVHSMTSGVPASIEGEAVTEEWVAATTAEGWTYFYSTMTGESVWELPAPLAEREADYSADTADPLAASPTIDEPTGDATGLAPGHIDPEARNEDLYPDNAEKVEPPVAVSGTVATMGGEGQGGAEKKGRGEISLLEIPPFSASYLQLENSMSHLGPFSIEGLQTQASPNPRTGSPSSSFPAFSPTTQSPTSTHTQGRTNNRGQSALHIAATACMTDGLRLLLDTGADPNQQDGRGLSPLLIACQQPPTDSQTACVQLLLERGARVDVYDSDGRTPLHLCAASGSAGCLALLLKWGADSNAVDASGDTALHVAAKAGQLACMQALLLGQTQLQPQVTREGSRLPDDDVHGSGVVDSSCKSEAPERPSQVSEPSLSQSQVQQHDWAEYVTEQGYTYYFHIPTQTSQWEKPDELQRPTSVIHNDHPAAPYPAVSSGEASLQFLDSGLVLGSLEHGPSEVAQNLAESQGGVDAFQQGGSMGPAERTLSKKGSMRTTVVVSPRLSSTQISALPVTGSSDQRAVERRPSLTTSSSTGPPQIAKQILSLGGSTVGHSHSSLPLFTDSKDLPLASSLVSNTAAVADSDRLVLESPRLLRERSASVSSLSDISGSQAHSQTPSQSQSLTKGSQSESEASRERHLEIWNRFFENVAKANIEEISHKRHHKRSDKRIDSHIYSRRRRGTRHTSREGASTASKSLHSRATPSPPISPRRYRSILDEVLGKASSGGRNGRSDPVLLSSLLLAACETCDVVAAEKLLQMGASPDSVDSKLQSAAHLSVIGPDLRDKHHSKSSLSNRSVSVTLLALLQDFGADLSVRDILGRDPLNFACELGNEPAAKFLLESAADVTSADDTGDTALHRAAASGHIGICRMLLRYGAVIGVLNRGGMTPLQSARNHNRHDIVQLLTNHALKQWNGDAGSDSEERSDGDASAQSPEQTIAEPRKLFDTSDEDGSRLSRKRASHSAKVSPPRPHSKDSGIARSRAADAKPLDQSRLAPLPNPPKEPIVSSRRGNGRGITSPNQASTGRTKYPSTLVDTPPKSTSPGGVRFSPELTVDVSPLEGDLYATIGSPENSISETVNKSLYSISDDDSHSTDSSNRDSKGRGNLEYVSDDDEVFASMRNGVGGAVWGVASTLVRGAFSLFGGSRGKEEEESDDAEGENSPQWSMDAPPTDEELRQRGLGFTPPGAELPRPPFSPPVRLSIQRLEAGGLLSADSVSSPSRPPSIVAAELDKQLRLYKSSPLAKNMTRDLAAGLRSPAAPRDVQIAVERSKELEHERSLQQERLKNPFLAGAVAQAHIQRNASASSDSGASLSPASMPSNLYSFTETQQRRRYVDVFGDPSVLQGDRGSKSKSDGRRR